MSVPVKLSREQLMFGGPAILVTKTTGELTAIASGQEHTAKGKGFIVPPNRTNLLAVAPPKPGHLEELMAISGVTPEKIPDAFDWRTSVPDIKIIPVSNQGACGSCWAVSSTNVLGDRFRIQGRKYKGSALDKVKLNPLYLLSCGGPLADGQCKGGQPIDAFKFFVKTGSVLDTGCGKSYEDWCQNSCCNHGKDCGNGIIPLCSDFKCDPKDVFKAKTGTFKSLFVCKTDSKPKTLTVTATESGAPQDINCSEFDYVKSTQSIQMDLLINGPIVGSFAVYGDFASGGRGTPTKPWTDTGGIYIYNGNAAFLGGHAVEIVGWGKGQAGKHGELRYWLVKNSWGTGWGDGGYFKIAMSIDSKANRACGIDIPGLVDMGQGQSLFGGAASFEPDMSAYEHLPPNCPNNCNGKGVCTGPGKCLCLGGEKGTDCGGKKSPLKPPTPSGKNNFNMLYMVVSAVAVVAMLWYFLIRNKKHKKRRKKK